MIERLKEIILPSIIEIVVHKKEKLTKKESQTQESFMKKTQVLKRKTEKSVIVAMIGLVGSGKSSVARELAGLIGATIISGDEIRVALRKEGERYEGTRKIAENVATEIVRHGGSVIFDSDHIDANKRASLRARARDVGVKLIFIRTYVNSSSNKKIPGFSLDEMVGRNMTAKPDEFFGGASTSWNGSNREKGAVVKLREMMRRIPHHYRWENKVGGRWILKKLPFKVFAEINTADSKWKDEVKNVVNRIK